MNNIVESRSTGFTIGTEQSSLDEIGRLIGKRRKLLGSIGEALIVKHLCQRGFSHVESNFRRRVGEIDVVMRKGGVTHIIEVKTVSRENIKSRLMNVNHETHTRGPRRITDKHTAEETVGARKMKRMARIIQIYLNERGLATSNWQFDVALVYLDHKNRVACIRRIENVTVEG